jgi:hypothetical protein
MIWTASPMAEEPLHSSTLRFQQKTHQTSLKNSARREDKLDVICVNDLVQVGPNKPVVSEMASVGVEICLR